jgi:inositol hexakisphosphate/diphosphoinositol-pentakisphosphate kinase
MEELPLVKLGICAMEKKVNSKHMQNILNEIRKYEFEMIIFSEKIIFNEEVEVIVKS